MSEIAQLAGARVLIVGDVMLDEYIWGDVRRISPEAPVPIVEVTRRSHVPGGAANVAAGIVAFGGQATIAGVIGADIAADNLRESLTMASVDVSGLIVDPARPTTCKTRVIAHAQQVVRTDHELRGPLPQDLSEQLLEGVRARLGDVDTIVLSDYGKGIVSEPAAQAVIAAAHEAGTPVIVDPKGLDFDKYRGATLVTPNELELSQAGHVHFDGEESVLRTARRMTADNDIGLLVTRGAHGMMLVAGDIEFTVPARARDVYDVTGAGDTVVSMLAVALGRRVDLRRAVELANEAAGIAVGKIGTSTVSLDELERWLTDRSAA
jgi:D-beta-D-heptose 7-phosphate kinase/D-beta-D-heptose 1-phosphate adenosyltransferase